MAIKRGFLEESTVTPKTLKPVLQAASVSWDGLGLSDQVHLKILRSYKIVPVRFRSSAPVARVPANYRNPLILSETKFDTKLYFATKKYQHVLRDMDQNSADKFPDYKSRECRLHDLNRNAEYAVFRCGFSVEVCWKFIEIALGNSIKVMFFIYFSVLWSVTSANRGASFSE